MKSEACNSVAAGMLMSSAREAGKAVTGWGRRPKRYGMRKSSWPGRYHGEREDATRRRSAGGNPYGRAVDCGHGRGSRADQRSVRI